ncbi:hypothetical protein AB7M63_006533 [Bradyrhizobium japonicum]
MDDAWEFSAREKAGKRPSFWPICSFKYEMILVGRHSACNIGSDSLLMQFGDVWRFDWGRISAMQQALHRSSLVPRGFVVESAYYEGDKAIVVVRASGSVGLCPSCGKVSRRVHSHYRRRVTDLPLSGRIVQLLVIARRFRL